MKTSGRRYWEFPKIGDPNIEYKVPLTGTIRVALRDL